MSGLVSVIIPAYNCEKFIAETIESVLRQTYTNFEVIIVDDGSTDNLEQVVGRFAMSDSRVRFIRQGNRGVSAARNNGFSQSKGNYVAFLDADDVWLLENLKVKVKLIDEAGAGLIHSDGVIIDEHSQARGEILKGMEGNVLAPLLLWKGTQIPGPSSILVKREVLDEVGLFDENLSTAADKDLFIRIAARYSIKRIGQVTWQYRIHPQNMHKNISLMESDMIAVYDKARDTGLFESKSFERKCYAALYLVLAASWAGDGGNRKRGFLFLVKALKKHPFAIFSILQRVVNRLILS
jgi:glycosyltransferase involved in cell wall biosynthesis